MIDLHYWPTPNGHKITLFLEEVGLPYTVVPVNIGRGDQFKPEFLTIAPNNRMPAIVDHAPLDGGAAIALFESGAILEYLAEKTGKFGGAELREKLAIRQWLFWQMGGLGPMLGQANHFLNYAPEKVPYGITRYTTEAKRLFGVLDRELAKRAYVGSDHYSIADMASYPWVVGHARIGEDLADYPHVKRWLAAIGARPATARALAVGSHDAKPLDDEAKKVLFGQK
jgi:GST-like protein